MKRLAIATVAFSLLVAACSSADTQSDVSGSEDLPTTTTTVFVEKTSQDYPEVKICPFDGSVDLDSGLPVLIRLMDSRSQLERNLKTLISDVNKELVLTRVYLGVLYLPGQKSINRENYFPASFSDFIGCDRAIVVFTVVALGDVGDADWTITMERWGKAIYEIATRIRADERFNEIEQVGIRTIWAADSGTMDGIMEMSEIRQVANSAFAEAYAKILLKNNWVMDIHRRYPKK